MVRKYYYEINEKKGPSDSFFLKIKIYEAASTTRSLARGQVSCWLQCSTKLRQDFSLCDLQLIPFF